VRLGRQSRAASPGRGLSRLVDSAEHWMESLPGPMLPPAGAETIRPRQTRWLLAAVAAAFGILLVRLGTLQLFNGSAFLAAAEGNRIRDEIDYAPRGTIYDRNGKILAENRPDYQLTATPYLLSRQLPERQAAYSRLAAAFGGDPAELAAQAEVKGLNYSLPILLAEHLSHQEVLRIEQELPALSGFSIDTVPVRHYRSEAGLAHVLGYVGRVSQRDLDKRDDILPTDFIGRGGVEAYYDSTLRGINGRNRVEVDALGRPVRLLAKQSAQRGSDLTLTIDYDIQVELERQLRRQMAQTGATRASAVAVDPGSGEVLAMVSLPFYDNNLFARGISTTEYRHLLENPDQPLVNKAIAGGYPSGSTIKPIVAAAALQAGVVDEHTVIVDRGAITVPNRYDSSITYTYRGWRPGGLGPMTVRRAIAMSSNIYFYTVGGGHGAQPGLGIERLSSYMKAFGLGQPTGIDLPGENDGLVPDPAWKEKAKGEGWFLGDTYNMSIGQGDLKVSVLQMTLADMAIGNGGQLPRPHVVKSVNGLPRLLAPARRVPVDPANLQIVREGMHEMIYRGPYCACRFAPIPVEIAGKTGTAETDRSGPQTHPHSWFIAYAPWDRPQIAVGIMVEQGGRSINAINPAVGLLERYFAGAAGR
jgi:penicillin-binding protein 2